MKANQFSLRVLAILIGLTVLGVPNLQAQYFGQNKVHYNDFHFKILKTDHFDIYYYPEESQSAELAARMAERWYARYAKLLNHDLSSRQPLILYDSHPAFEQTNAISGQLGEGTGGVTESIKRRIVLPVGASLAETDHVIGHELVHAFQYDIGGLGRGASNELSSSIENSPLWFIEGMAEFLSIGPEDPNTAMWIRDASQNKLPNLKEMDDPKYFPYRYGQALWAYISGRWGDESVKQLLRGVTKSRDFGDVIRKTLHVGADTLSQDWHAAIHSMYDSVLTRAQKPTDFGPVLVKGVERSDDLNVAPALSPDGKYMAFMSSKSLFAIDVFLADAETGEVQRSIVKNELDPHFESLQFIYSAGAWNPGSNLFVFSAINKSKPILSILDIYKNKIQREIKFKDLSEIFNPTWSPDGRFIAFSALKGGFSDLFIYDLAADSLRRVTNDVFADLQPCWSPDGKRIAFVTDRFSTNPDDLKTGNYHLALLEVASKAIKPIPDFETGKNLNPQWSPDSQSLYFVSDHTGISNIYRLDLATNAIFQLTNLFTGVTGITPISPAISVSGQTGRIVYSVYENGVYSIYSLTPQTQQGGELLTSTDGKDDDDHGDPALLPPSQRKSGDLTALLQDTDFGLPTKDTFTTSKYHPKLSLNYIGQPYLGAGVDRFGAFLEGGASLAWSDLLGNRNLVTILQTTNNFKDFAGLVGYENTGNRWYWGFSAQQVPYFTGGYNTGYATVNGEPAYFEEQIIQRQIDRSVSGLLAYPLSRVKRFEFSISYQHISYSQTLETLAISQNTGATLINDKQDLQAPGSLHFAQPSAAFVYDNSYYGAASPILGQRYRLEVTPNVGSFFFTNLLLDYRRYFMPIRPYTLAFRVLHFGRFGSGAENENLSPLYIGYPGLVRGYDFNSFAANESVVNQLSGSKILVGNFELRMPLYNLLTLGHGFFYGGVPLEFAGFFDTGVAWQNSDKAWFLGGNRHLVSSVGLALRTSLGGYLALELDYTHPYDRPNKGWIWQFNITSGF